MVYLKLLTNWRSERALNRYMPSGGVDRLNLATEGLDLGNDVERLLCKGCEKGLRLKVLQGRCGFGAVHAMVLKWAMATIRAYLDVSNRTITFRL
jgi:hypothetical protein